MKQTVSIPPALKMNKSPTVLKTWQCKIAASVEEDPHPSLKLTGSFYGKSNFQEIIQNENIVKIIIQFLPHAVSRYL